MQAQKEKGSVYYKRSTQIIHSISLRTISGVGNCSSRYMWPSIIGSIFT